MNMLGIRDHFKKYFQTDSALFSFSFPDSKKVELATQDKVN